MHRARYPYRLVNVFAERHFAGKTVAVFTDASGMSSTVMAAVAREMHVPQCVFVFPPPADSPWPRVRVFTPSVELPRSGLPMIATVFALQLGPTWTMPVTPPGRFVVEQAEEPVSVAYSAPVFTVRHPVPRFEGVYPEKETAAALLSLRPDQLATGPLEVVSSGVPYVIVPVKNAGVLASARLRESIWERTLRHFEASNILAFALQQTAPWALAHLRVFTPAYGVPEEAASETAIGPLLGYILRHGLTELPAEAVRMCSQGTELGRPSVLHAAFAHSGAELSSLRVGGECIVMGEGHVYV